MAVDVTLRCTCGEVTGRARGASPTTGVRLVCYCDDCQSFAHWLGRPGDILDGHGGSEVYQFSPSRITFETGMEHVQCMRLSPKGTLRWYADCCNTPICNAMSNPGVPFASLIQPFMVDDGRRDDTLGPIRARVQATFAHGDPGGGEPGVRMSTLARSLWRLLRARLGGEHRPSPFFQDGALIVKPTVVSLEEREQLRQTVRPAAR